MAHRKIKPQIPQQGKIGAEAVNLSFGFSYLHDTVIRIVRMWIFSLIHPKPDDITFKSE